MSGPVALVRLHFHRLFSQQQKQQSNTLPNYCQHGKVIKISQIINTETLPKGTVLTGCSTNSLEFSIPNKRQSEIIQVDDELIINSLKSKN